MNAKAEEFRRRADECDRKSAVTGDPSKAREFHFLAMQWREMAAQADQRDSEAAF